MDRKTFAHPTSRPPGDNVHYGGVDERANVHLQWYWTAHVKDYILIATLAICVVANYADLGLSSAPRISFHTPSTPW
jgi:hypothetical protein